MVCLERTRPKLRGSYGAHALRAHELPSVEWPFAAVTECYTPPMAAHKWAARTWRGGFFEVFAPNSYIRPLRPLPLTEAECHKRAARDHRDKPENITRLNIRNDAGRK